MLHITNGDSAVGGLKQAGYEGVFLPWRDVLHVGPVPQTNDWQSFDSQRTQFMVNAGWGSQSEIESGFRHRRSVMNALTEYDRIYLWFEHDLYDQLQLMQILCWLNEVPEVHDRVTLIVTDLYLGYAEADDFDHLLRFAEALTPQHLAEAMRYWHAVTQDSPEALLQLPASDLLPFMAPAIKRLCEEYPSVLTGLNRTQTAALSLLKQPMAAGQLFRQYQQTESAMFMGDMPFWDVLEGMIDCAHPLLSKSTDVPLKQDWKQVVQITEMGRSVLAAHAHHVTLNGIDQWIGGVYLTQKHTWCYDNKEHQFKNITPI